jgi:hypothetical protein
MERLAIQGGKPVRDSGLSFGRQSIDDEDNPKIDRIKFEVYS